MRNIFRIPWGHHICILNKCKGNQEKALFFVEKTMENNWSRAVLLNFLDTNLYEREGDGPTIGLLICKTKDNVLAKYAVNSSNKMTDFRAVAGFPAAAFSI